jgi:MFS family permease
MNPPHKHREVPSGLTKEQTRKSLRNSTRDGSSAMASFGLTANYVTPYALTMQATTQQIGYLSSIPNFANMLISLFSPMVSERIGSRKKLLVWAVFFQAALWFPVMLIPFIFQTNLVWWLIVFITLSTAVGGLIGPPWSSMTADLAPASVRGRYFGRRVRLTNFIALVFSFAAGGLLQLFTGNTRMAFAIIFAGAGIARLLSCYFITQINEPHPVLPANPRRESIPQIARSLWSTNIGRFIIFAVFLSLAQNIDAPFFSVYLLRELQISYISYQIINATIAIVVVLVSIWWGQRADRAGNLKVLHITALMIPFISLLYPVSPSVIWLCGVQVFAGFAWAGFNLCVGLFIWDAAPQDNRTRFVALFSAMNALGITLGSLISGNLGPHLPTISGSYFLTLFLVAGTVKLIVVLGLFRRISEVRSVQTVKTAELLFGGIQSATADWWRRVTKQSR